MKRLPEFARVLWLQHCIDFKEYSCQSSLTTYLVVHLGSELAWTSLYSKKQSPQGYSAMFIKKFPPLSFAHLTFWWQLVIHKSLLPCLFREHFRGIFLPSTRAKKDKKLVFEVERAGWPGKFTSVFRFETVLVNIVCEKAKGWYRWNQPKISAHAFPPLCSEQLYEMKKCSETGLSGASVPSGLFLACL